MHVVMVGLLSCSIVGHLMYSPFPSLFRIYYFKKILDIDFFPWQISRKDSLITVIMTLLY